MEKVAGTAAHRRVGRQLCGPMLCAQAAAKDNHLHLCQPGRDKGPCSDNGDERVAVVLGPLAGLGFVVLAIA